MAVSIPTSVKVELDAKYVNSAGKKGTLYTIASTILEAGAKRVTHKTSIQGAEANKIGASDFYKGGADVATAEVQTLVNVGDLADGDTIKVEGPKATYTYTAVSGSPGTREFVHSGTPATQATNIAAVIHADRVALGIASAIASSADVAVTGPTNGRSSKITLTITTPGNLTISTTTGGVGPAYFTLDITKTPTAGTQIVYEHNLNINGVDRDIQFVYVVQTNDTATLIVAGLAKILQDGINGVDKATILTHHGFIKGLGPQDQPEDLQTAMEGIWDTANSFRATVARLRIELGDKGVEGNSVPATIINNLCPPDVILVDDQTLIPQGVAGLKAFTKFQNFVASGPQNTVKVNPNSQLQEDALPTTTAFTVTFEFLNTNDVKVILAGSGRSGFGYTSDGELAVLVFNAGSVEAFLQGKQLLLVFDDENDGAGVLKLHKVLLTNVEFTNDPTKLGVYKVTALVQVIPFRVDGTGYMYKLAA